MNRDKIIVILALLKLVGLSSGKASENISNDKPVPLFTEHVNNTINSATDGHKAVKRQIVQPDGFNYIHNEFNGLNNSPNSSIGTMTVNNTYLQIYSMLMATENIISSPVITNWGSWGNWENCSSGQYAIGFQLKSEAKKIMKGSSDNTALNAISILCGKPERNDAFSYPTSTVGAFGYWGEYFYCNGLLTGFQLRSEGDQGSGDNTAANNMRGICNSKGKEVIIEGDGNSWGDWTAEQRCDPGKAVCAIQTQVQIPSKVKVDNTSLNNVKMKCCMIKG